MKLKIFDKSGSNTSDAVLLVQKAVLKTNLKPNLEDQAARYSKTLQGKNDIKSRILSWFISKPLYSKQN